MHTIPTRQSTGEFQEAAVKQVLEGNRSLTAWIAVDRGLAVTEAGYQAQGWPLARRIMVVRQEVAERPQAQGKLLKNLTGYQYQLVVTNLTLPPSRSAAVPPTQGPLDQCAPQR